MVTSVCSPCPQVHLWFEERLYSDRVVSCQTNMNGLFTYKCFLPGQEHLSTGTVLLLGVFRHKAWCMITIDLNSEWLDNARKASLFQNVILTAAFGAHEVIQEVFLEVTCLLNLS